MLPDILEIGKRRRQLDITQTELAKMAGVSQSLIAKMEAGKVDPSYSNVKRLFDSLQQLEKHESVSAKDIMTASILALKKSDSVSHAARIIRSKGISQLPVIEGERIIGSLSETTITAQLASGAEAAKLWSRRVGDIMEEPFPTVSEGTPLSAVTPLLQHNGAVLVMRGGKERGIITKADLLKAIRK